MVDVTHDRHHRRARHSLAFIGCFVGKQLFINVGRRYRLGDMTKLFYHQSSRVLIDHLVNRHHGAHVEQHLDDLITLDGEPFREICHRNALWNLNLVDYRGSRALKTMLRIAARRNRPAPQRRLALASAALVAGNV